MAVALEQELATFRAALPGLLAEGHRGKFAIVRGGEVAGVWSSFDDALQAGYDRFGLEQFMVKEIVEHEQPRYFSRNVSKCP